jgi:hypothetical protein
VEMVKYQNVGFLDSGSSIRVSDYKFTSHFASGSLFSSSVLDAAVCQVDAYVVLCCVVLCFQ